MPLRHGTVSQPLRLAGCGTVSVRLLLPYAQVILSSGGVNGTGEFLGAS